MSICFLRKNLQTHQYITNEVVRFWISKLPAGLSLVQLRIILFPIVQTDFLISLLAECQRQNPAVFADTDSLSLRPLFVGDITQAEKFNIELQLVKKPYYRHYMVDITFVYTPDLD